MKLLIYANEDDVHAGAVAWAFAQVGQYAHQLLFERFPKSIRGSMSISDETDLSILSRVDEQAIDHAAFDVVWNRRISTFGKRNAGVPDGLDPQDASNVKRTAKVYSESVRSVAWPDQIWVNPRHAQRRIEDKMFQLRLARECGLPIPRTLISNDPDEIRAFVSSIGDVVAKPLSPLMWTGENWTRIMPTVAVNLADLGPDIGLAACPMIYQERIAKAYEVRAVLFGSELICGRLNSQAAAGAETDFRLVNPKMLGVEPCSVPRRVEDALLRFARTAEILHGSFDLVVGDDGAVTFLEINEQGQTLWLEECNRDIRVLDRLTEFLMAPTEEYKWSGRRRFAFGDFPISSTNYPAG